MNLEIKGNKNYTAEVIRINNLLKLDNCDNVVAAPIYGYQAIVGKDAQIGDLVVLFTAETQLSKDYVSKNNLYRKKELNTDVEKAGYLEENRRVKAIKFRGHTSSALMMPLSSLEAMGIDISTLKEGDVFDTINGLEVCRKYVIKGNERSGVSTPKQNKEEKVDKKLFPEHLDTENYFRNSHKINNNDIVVVTQKLHGSSGRFANIPINRKLTFWEKLAQKLGIKVQDTEFAYVAGSRKVIKEVNKPQQHFYSKDIWNEVLQEIKTLIPENTIVYGEIVGWVDDKQIQKDFTYTVPQGEWKFYVYRIATINSKGFMIDYSWNAVKEFCKNNGLLYVPEIWTGKHIDLISRVDSFLDVNYNKIYSYNNINGYNEEPVPLDIKSVCDEGVCIRVEGIIPKVYKAKSPAFLQNESKQLDSGEQDMESAESEEVAL